MELCGALSTGKPHVYNKKIPHPRAPTFSHGADRGGGSKFTLLPPGIDVNANTSVTQKMMDVDDERGSQLVKEYEDMQNLAIELEKLIVNAVKTYLNKFEFVVRTHLKDEHFDYRMDELSLMQQIAIGKLYLDGMQLIRTTATHPKRRGG